MSPDRELTQAETEYRQLRQAKKRMRDAKRNYNAAYVKVSDAFLKNTDTYAESLRRIDDPQTAVRVDASFCAVVETSRAHQAALEELNSAIEDYLEIERDYIFATINRLKDNQGLRDSEISEAYGVYQTSLIRWMQTDRQRRAELCETELEEDSNEKKGA